MDLSLAAILVGAVLVVSLLLGLALALLTQRAEDSDPDTGILATLAAVRSPSGRPFFPTAESVEDFVTTLDASRAERQTRR